MTKRWRSFLTILLCPIFFGFGLVNIDLEYLPILWEKDKRSYNHESSGLLAYIMFHTLVPLFLGAWVPWIGWHRSPLNPINHSSVVNETNQAGQTLLHIVAMKGDKKHAVLISNGANLNAQQKYGGMTPLDMANYEKKSKIADLLRKHGAKTGEELKTEAQ
mgnify:CR=1 FL=1